MAGIKRTRTQSRRSCPHEAREARRAHRRPRRQSIQRIETTGRTLTQSDGASRKGDPRLLRRLIAIGKGLEKYQSADFGRTAPDPAQKILQLTPSYRSLAEFIRRSFPKFNCRARSFVWFQTLYS
jgi:hypothetical protein